MLTLPAHSFRQIVVREAILPCSARGSSVISSGNSHLTEHRCTFSRFGMNPRPISEVFNSAQTS